MKLHLWTYTGAGWKGKTLLRLLGSGTALKLTAKNLWGEMIMIMKSLSFMRFHETLHLPPKVLYALHKASLGSARSSGCGSGTQKPCGTEESHIQKQTVTGLKRDHLTLLWCSWFSELKGLSWNRKAKWELSSDCEHLDRISNDSELPASPLLLPPQCAALGKLNDFK